MVARIHAQSMWDAIKTSVETMDRPHKDVLTLRIYQGLSWTSIQERLPYGETRAREILYEAMLWFADAFSHHKELRVFNVIQFSVMHMRTLIRKGVRLNLCTNIVYSGIIIKFSEIF